MNDFPSMFETQVLNYIPYASHSSIITFGISEYKVIIFPTSRFVPEPHYRLLSLSNILS